MMSRKLGVILELLFFISCAVVAFILFPYQCQNLSLSSFYISSTSSYASIVDRNEERAAIAVEYLNSHEFPQLFKRVNSSQTKYCIVIVSAKRSHDTKYLTQVVAKVAHSLLSTRDNYTFAVYNVDAAHHTEALHLSKMVPVISHPDKPATTINERYEKEKRDYVAAMKWCADKQSDYNIVLEDDALPSDDLMPILGFVLRHCISGSDNSWAALQMFYPEKFQGWGDSPTYINELIIAAALLGLAFTLISSLILPGPLLITCSPVRVVVRRLFFWRWFLSGGLVLYLLLCLGRAHWEELLKTNQFLMSVTRARGCCTPAMLYPRQHTQELVDYLDSIKCSSQLPVDIAIDNFIRERKLRKLRTVPNLFWHIGMVSSLAKSQKSVKEYGLLFPPRMNIQP